MKIQSRKLLSGLVVLIVAQSTWAFENYLSRIPNSSAFSCGTCHNNPTNPGSRNSFGNAFASAGRAWNASLAGLDSDGDGATNGQELRDPDGDGAPIDSTGVTNPGNPNSTPPPPPPPAPTVSVAATDANASEVNSDNGTFRITRTGATTAALVVAYTLGGTASNGSDYQTLATTVTIAAGSASADITVDPISDTQTEGNETVVLTLSAAPSGGTPYTVGTPNNATVTIADTPAPPPPTELSVTLTSPADGATFTAPASIPLRATVIGGASPIQKVEFFSNGTLLDTDTAAPYEVTVNNVPAGAYSLTARVTDNANATATSPAVNVTVNEPSANKAPVVTLIMPNHGERFKAPARILLLAKATDPDGSIAKVEFFAGTMPLGLGVLVPVHDDDDLEDLEEDGDHRGKHQFKPKSIGKMDKDSDREKGKDRKGKKHDDDDDDEDKDRDRDHGDRDDDDDDDGDRDDDDEDRPRKQNLYFLIVRDAPAGEYVITAMATDNQGATATSNPARVEVKARNKGHSDDD